MSAPLVVNTRDGVCWTRRAVTSGGIALYAPESVKTCPQFVMATIEELAEHGIVGSAHALPMPVGPKPDEPIRTIEAALAALGPLPDSQRPEHGPLWSLLDWSLWGAGMGDLFREALADRMLAAIPKRGRAHAEALMAEFIERRRIEKTGVTVYQEQRNEVERLRARVAELEAHAAQLAPFREAALHDLATGTQWRVIATDSESLTGLAPVCTADRRLHEIPDYPGGPKYDDEGVYDCCPWPQVETYSVAVAAYLVALLNADAAKGSDVR